MPATYRLGPIKTTTLTTGYNPLWLGQTYITDLNNDGNGDLVLLGAYYPMNGNQPAPQPGLVAFGDGNGGFTLATQQQFPLASLTSIHPREVVFADFNGDGYKDMVIGDQGLDGPPFPGAQNRLYLSNGDGTWRDATANLPALSDFTHSLSVGDVNGDGKPDLIVGNVPQPNPAPPYILINDGAGNFTRNDALLPLVRGQFLGDGNLRMTSSLLADLDGDGRAELVVGTGFSTAARPAQAQILWNENGAFKSASTALPLPALFGAQHSVYDIQAMDVNFDGRQDLILTYQKDFDLGGWEMQVLINEGGHNFVDRTTQYLPDPASRSGGQPSAGVPESQYWVQFLNVADINGDGRLDFTVDARGITNAPSTLPVAYIHQADGSFQTVTAAIAGQSPWLFDFSTQYDTWQGGSGFVHVSLQGGKVEVQTLPVSFDPVDPPLMTGTAPVQRVGTAQADRLYGAAANDTLKGLGGDDMLDGGAGIDTALYDGVRANYTISRTASGYTVKDNTGVDGTDTLVNIERLQFADARVAIDTAGNGGMAYRLYQAAFNRTPDQGGLGFQMKALDSGATLVQVAGSFIGSAEFQKTYGALNDTQFATQLYQNVLHRAPDAAGLAYHVDSLARGVSRAEVLVVFSESPENQAALIGTIQNGMVYTA